MTELTIPEGTDDERAAELVLEFLETGAVVEVRNRDMAEDDPVRTSGKVTGFETDEDGRGYLEIEGMPVEQNSVYFGEIHTVSKLEEG